ncbi:NACHT domain-containing protein [Streptomyces sp. NPDC060065]|uniref:NACHT domain-containing protein n=1 Tax=Streptomyces sp. NPDC060065 TaxID=3347050 RepID=UPI0036B1F179
MSEPLTGPVPDFCAELGRLVRACRVPQGEIAESLGKSGSSVSELLNGRRRKPPEWDDVRLIVRLCAERGGRGVQQVVGLSLDVRWWKGRHAELERTVEAARGRGVPGQGPEPGQGQGVFPAALDATVVTDLFEALNMSIDRAVDVLAAGRPTLANAADHLLDTLHVHGSPESPGLLDALLEGFPERVRAAHGVARGAQLQAARMVLAVAALGRCAAVHVRWSDVPKVVQNLLGHSARTHVWTGSHWKPANLQSLMGTRAKPVELTEQLFVDHYLRLAAPVAAACPEFALAAGLPGVPDSSGHTAGDGTGLSGLGALLAEFAGRDEPSPSGRTLLYSPITSLDARGPRIPSMAEGYVDPRFRVAGPDTGNGSERDVASDKWWEEQPLHDGIERFLATYLLSLPALLTPLVVLGHPGAGKSLLTKLLTARLPAREFRPLRVELRHTPAEDDVQAQLEHALRRATGRSVSWPDWSESEPRVIPVVLLDGFDELLQAGAHLLDSARQWGYLQLIEEFQQREAELGRPLIVVVTSRTVVADRAHLPRNSHVLRIEPFEEPEIERWLAIWNTTNRPYLEQHDLRPLSLAEVAPHSQLAAQPLLLLMLALYDADGNALRRLGEEGLSRTELYDRLLRSFIRRQIVKDGLLPASEERAAVDRELHSLSVIALGMFHRGAQAITGEEADRDLRALGNSAVREETGDRGLLFGRFFFVHEAQAVVTKQRLRSYEFMHATFGEHLVARLIEEALRRLTASARDGERLPDDGELYALLSFVPLTDRAQIMQNLGDMLNAWRTPPARDALPRLVAELFRAVSWDTAHRTDLGHAPARLTRTCRDTVYGANLLLIGVLAAGEVLASQFLGVDDLIDNWRRHTMMLRSQLSEESWDLYLSTLSLERFWQPAPGGVGRPLPDLRISTPGVSSVGHELNWPLDLPISELATRRGASVWYGDTEDIPHMVRQVTFAGDSNVEVLLHALYPMLHRMPSTLRTYHVVDDKGRIQSAAQSLIALLTSDTHNPAALPALYDRCLTAAGSLPHEETTLYLEAVSRQLVHDVPRLPDSALASVLRRFAHRRPEDINPSMWRALRFCLHQALGRGERELNAVLADVHGALVGSSGRRAKLTSPESELLQLLWTSTGLWASVREPDLDEALSRLDLEQTAAREPSALIDLLRLAAELGLDDWLTTHAGDLLQALPRNAFGLLRPSDLRYLRDALPAGAYEDEFANVEWVWRGNGSAPSPATDT